MVQIAIAAPADLWPCRADPAQLENALLNLTINARDAMPDGGELVLEASNATLNEDDVLSAPEVPAGDYLRISVRDTGIGMSNEVQARAFEPFFTTKEVGAGSGLGLSMIYGFVRQSGGHVQVTSEAGSGSEVTLYLPRAEQPRTRAEAEPEVEIPTGSGESILVVEDEAPGGASGRDLAREVRALRPDVKVALMSGYSADLFSGDGDAVLLRKPFKKAELARKIRTVLAASR
jgi:hypothetical protein